MQPRLLLFILISILVPALCLAAPKKKTSTERRINVPGNASAADGRQRIALVIGNSSYLSSPLKNPANDARAMAAVLRRLGFEVDEKINLGYFDMNKAVESFGKKLKSGGVGLFYFAGHGMQVNGANYLIPVDARIEDENEVRFKALDAGLVLAKMEQSKSDVNLVVLDACRDNPFSRSFRTTSRGLSSMDAPNGTFIAYATAPGKTAADGSGSNGVYTEALIKAIETPGLKVEEVFKQVRRIVVEKTARAQTPWESSSLMGDFLFIPPTVADTKTDVPQTQVAMVPRPQARPSKPANSDSFTETTTVMDREQLNITINRYLEQVRNGDITNLPKLKELLAAHGSPEAQYSLGTIYHNYDNKGVMKDYAEALKWYRKAAEKGYANAQSNLGFMYRHGQGVAKDEAEAIRWYRKAAEQGNAHAQYNLGSMYHDGRGVSEDHAEALKWYLKAAEQGLANAQSNLGFMYHYGQGVAKDEDEAVRWYRKAAEQGQAEAIQSLKNRGLL